MTISPLWYNLCCLTIEMTDLRPVLMVDDEPNDELLLKFALRHECCSNPLQRVGDVEEAIQYLDGSGPFADRAAYPFPVLMLLDSQLPRRSGLEVLRWLNEHPLLRAGLTIVAWSSFLSPDIVKRVEALGVEAVLEKPMYVEDLQQHIRRFKSLWPHVFG